MSLSLRARFLLVLLGAVAPLGLVGFYLARRAPALGEELLRQRLQESLGEIVHLTGLSWVTLRSRLLNFASDPEVLTLLRANRSDTTEISASWLQRHALDDVVESVAFYDSTGAVAESARRNATQGRGAAQASIPLRLAIHEPGTGGAGRVWSLGVRVRAEALLPGEMLLSGVGGSVLAAFEPESNTQLLPQPIDAELFSRPRFLWSGQRWVSVMHELDEPRLRLALAGPSDPFTTPLRRVTLQGTIALVVVTLSALAVVAVGTQRLTRALDQLALTSDAVARGEMGRTVPESGPQELRRVARAFNTMSASLRRTLERSAQREALAAVGEFAASLAHEVRNPLTSIRLDLERARAKAAGNESTSELITRALEEIDRLDHSVAGALRLARSGRLELGRIDLRHPLEAAIHASEPRFGERGAELLRGDWPNAAVWVHGDSAALEQLALNLLLNGADALDAGGTVTVEIREHGADITVLVTDSGIGMSADQLERAFEPLYSTKPGGTGLGLPVARRIAEAHGGSLRLESTPGHGTRAIVAIPREQA